MFHYPKRARIKKVSGRQAIINACLDLIREQLKSERGNKCEICGRTPNNLGLFHILPRSRYPRLMLNTFNLLLTDWFPCHQKWHHDYFKAPEIEKRIIELRGADYKDRLLVIDKISPKLTITYLKSYLKSLQKLKEVEG